MRYTVACFELGFICEWSVEGETREDVLVEVLTHLDEVHGTGAGSTGLKHFVGLHIDQVDDDTRAPAESPPEPGARRGSRAGAGLTTWIANRSRRRGSQPNPDQEHAT
jgi:predicted small metal-binding protein